MQDAVANMRFRELMTPRTNEYLTRLQPNHPKQSVGMLLPHKEVLFGGAAGGGKSDWLLRSALQYVDVPGYAALILRSTVASLSLAGGLIPRSQEWLAGTGAKWNAQQKTWYFPSGATLTFGFLSSSQDRYKYASSEFQFIGFEELTEFPREEDYTFMFSRLRGPIGSPVPLRMRATTNPVGVGFAWVKQRFVPGGAPINTPERFFLPSSLDDNPSIDTAEYESGLKNLGSEMYRKLREGDWSDMEAGEYFPRSVAEIIEPHELPKNLLLEVRAWDLAGTKPSAANPDPDWSVGIRLARTNAKSDVTFVRHVKRFRESPDITEQTLFNTAREDGKRCYIRSEQEPGQAGKAQISHFAKALRRYSYDGIRVSGKKELRAGPASAAWREGRIILVDDGTGWLSPFLDELDFFPYGLHDDQVDALSLGFNFLTDARPKYSGPRFGPRLG